MPTVPTYDGPQVREQVLQGGFQNANQYTNDARGMQDLGRGLLDVGATTDRIAQREAQRTAYEVQTAIQAKYLEFQQQYQKTRQGDKAKGLTDEVDKWWSEAATNTGKGLDRLSQSLVSRALVQARQQALAGAGQFENMQLDAATDTSWNAAKVTAKSTAVANPFVMVPGVDAQGNPTTVTGIDAARADLRQKNAEYAARKGLTDPKVLEALNLKDTTELHTQVLQGLARNDPDAATAYYAKYKDEISGQVRAETEEKIQLAGSVAKAQAFGDEVTASGMTLDAALAEARKRFSGEAEVRAVAEVKTRFVEQDAIQVANDRKLVKSAWAQLLATGSINGIDPSIQQALRARAPEEERQMRDWLQAKARQAKADAEGKQDPEEFGRYYTYRRMAMDNPAEFANLDLTKIQPYVSRAQLNHLTEIQGSISRSDAKALNSQRQLKQTVDMVKGTILASGIDLTPKEGSKKAQDYANFMGALTQALDDAQRAQPDRPLTPAQMREIGMDMLREGYEQGSGFLGIGKNVKRGYQIATDPTLAGKTFISTPFDKIPAGIRADLEKQYDAMHPRGGIYGNETERMRAVERAYQRGLEQKRFAR